MCGITGYIGKGFREVISVMNESQKHRGPDEEGYFLDPDVELAFGHKRLSIVDTVYGQQPFYNEDKSVILVFNGEIFNAAPLRKQLETSGIAFITDHSDTEVLLKMYEHHGIGMINMLNGMFSFVIYDKNDGKIIGARDRFGIKPLFYRQAEGSFAFASEVNAILSHPVLGKQINLQAVSHYLSFQCVPAPMSIYEGINKIPAAHHFIYDLQSRYLKVSRYWQPVFGDYQLPENELHELLRTTIEDAVKRWSISDVEIGCSLSGGLDSSIITMLATKNQSHLKTYTVGFEGFNHLDERTSSRKLAAICGTDHNEIIVTEKDILGSIPSMVRTLQEPYGGGLPSWFIYAAMSKQLKVCLTGSGGDELFGNYGKWRMYKSLRDYLYTIRKNFTRLNAIDCLKHPQGCFYYKFLTEKEKKLIIEKSDLQSSSSLIQNYWNSSLSTDPKDAVVSVDTQLQLPEEFLFMTDRFSMNFSMEARTPMLDTELSDFVYSLSPKIRSKRDDPKNLLRESFKKLLPEEIVHNPKKGFVLPLESWIKDQFKNEMNELFDNDFLKRQGIFKPGLMNIINRLPGTEYYTERIWTLLMFQFWYKYSFRSS